MKNVLLKTDYISIGREGVCLGGLFVPQVNRTRRHYISNLKNVILLRWRS